MRTTNFMYAQKLYVMNENSGFTEGVSGSFSTPDGKTVTVTNGVITSIL